MLNGGADILTVQDLLAHVSPEMTLRYARLLDDTKRIAFEKVVKQGLFTFDLNGQIHQVQEAEEIPESIMDLLWKNEKLNALDNPYGSCRARINGNCPLAAEPPCLTANDGKPCFDLSVGISDMDIKKYEIHIESSIKMIEAAKQFGREDMVEANQKNLERFQSIYDTIKTGNLIYGRFDREEQLKQLHEKWKQATEAKVEKAIKQLTKNSKAINFNSVAKEAGVAKATLYNHIELKERIDFLRKQQEKVFMDNRIKRDENNQNALIASPKRRVEKLER